MGIDDMRVPRRKGIDKRIRLSEADKAKIIEAHKAGASINGLAREYKVNKRLVQFILYPERHLKNLQDRKARGGSVIYYEKDKHKVYMQEHRAHKRALNLNGIIGEKP